MKYAQAAIILVALCLSGCSGTRLVDSQVESFSTLKTLPTPATYRFERLPSQQASPQAQAAQSALEAMAQNAMAKAGLQAAGTAAAYTAAVSARTERDDYGAGVYGHRLNDGIFAMPLMDFPRPYYKRELSLVLRDAKSNAVVYETRARNEGRWSDSAAIFPAMLDAALQGFPQPPAGPRRVDVQIPW
jgi:hypothetical protein